MPSPTIQRDMGEYEYRFGVREEAKRLKEDREMEKLWKSEERFISGERRT